tara:strand:- start:8569 stop:9141 length:573 start_codon:yes stop_codon:yes gene_type:complete
VNHLAHFYLAGEDPNLSIGNYIADHVKGNKKDNYSPEIKRGIEMHRSIDHYTDTHPLVRENVGHIKPILGRYSSIALDVIYDYFLANNWNQYSNQNLQEFSNNRYKLLESNYDTLPTNSQHFYHYMIRNNILFNYQFQDRLERVFFGMSTRTKFKSELHRGVEALLANHEVLEQNFSEFFNELKTEFANW